MTVIKGSGPAKQPVFDKYAVARIRSLEIKVERLQAIVDMIVDGQLEGEPAVKTRAKTGPRHYRPVSPEVARCIADLASPANGWTVAALCRYSEELAKKEPEQYMGIDKRDFHRLRLRRVIGMKMENSILAVHSAMLTEDPPEKS